MLQSVSKLHLLAYTCSLSKSSAAYICVSFKQPLCLTLHVPADYLRETSFVEEPSGELVVHEDQTLQVPCVINTAADTNLSQVYWSTGSSIQSLIREVLLLSEEDAALNYSSTQTCARYRPDYGRIFYTAHHRHVHDDSGAVMLEASLRLYLCNVQEGDSSVFQCWHPDISRRMILQVQTG